LYREVRSLNKRQIGRRVDAEQFSPGLVYSSFIRYTVRVPNARTCVVSFRDPEGLEHSVVVIAVSLYAAAARALKAFKESPFCDGARPGLNLRHKYPN